MAQYQGPPPDITSVISVNQSLRVTWSNNPYSVSNEATLLYIDTDSNIMYSILLNQEEILQEEYNIIYNLEVGHNYAVFFSILAIDGNTHNSDTVTCVYATVPFPPVLDSITVSPTTANAIVTISAVDVGSNTTKLVFRILREGYSVTSQQFNYDSTPGYTYTLTDLVPDSSYIVSVQAQNSIGYSNVSNSIQFINNNSPPAPSLNQINSGVDQTANLTFSGTAGSGGIDSFNFYANGVLFDTLVQSVAPNATYSASYSLTGLTNGIGYDFKVAGVNSAGQGLYSNIQKAVPSTRLIFNNVIITFPDSNTIRVDWDSNISTWADTGITKLQLRENNTIIADLTYSNTNGSSHFIQHTYTLEPTALYVCQLIGDQQSASSYTVVPSNLLSYWTVSVPPLYTIGGSTNGLIVLNSSVGEKIYSTVPGPVSNITYSTFIDTSSQSANNGSITYNWNAASANGGSNVMYTLNLYTIVNGSRSQTVTAVGETNALTFTFNNLSTTPAYSVEIIASNSVGSGPSVNYPLDTATGIYILAGVNPVTGLTAIQNNYDGTNFTGKLSWNYYGPGNGYSNAIMWVYLSVDGGRQSLGSIEYIQSTNQYEFDLDLGTVTNTTFNYIVNVVANVDNSSPLVQNTSTDSTASVTTGLPPVITNIVVSNPNSIWQISFKVTNATSGIMIPNSIVSIVMPNPLSDISTIIPIYNGYNTNLVPNGPDGHIFTHVLGYNAIANDYATVIASNEYGCTVVNQGWGN